MTKIFTYFVLYNTLFGGSALGECVLGMALLLCGDATRRWAALALIALHIVLLLAMSPLGANAYMEVWPWNFLCIVLLWTLFVRPPAEVNYYYLF